MAYQPRIQRDRHTLTLACHCSSVSRHIMAPGAYRITCGSCHKVWIVGNALFDATGNQHRQLAPADVAIPYSSAPPGPPLAAEPSEEPTVRAGKWHSAEPITLDMPGHDRPLPELWRDRVTGELWRAVKFALGTRMMAAPCSQPLDRITVSRREWLVLMERVDE